MAILSVLALLGCLGEVVARLTCNWGCLKKQPFAFRNWPNVTFEVFNYRPTPQKACFHLWAHNTNVTLGVASPLPPVWVGPLDYKHSITVTINVKELNFSQWNDHHQGLNVRFGYSLALNSNDCHLTPQIEYTAKNYMIDPGCASDDWVPQFMIGNNNTIWQGRSNCDNKMMLEVVTWPYIPQSEKAILKVSLSLGRTASVSSCSNLSLSLHADVWWMATTYQWEPNWKLADCAIIGVETTECLTWQKQVGYGDGVWENPARVNLDINFTDSLLTVCNATAGFLVSAVRVGDGSANYPFEIVYLRRMPERRFTCNAPPPCPTTLTTGKMSTTGTSSSTTTTTGSQLSAAAAPLPLWLFAVVLALGALY